MHSAGRFHYPPPPYGRIDAVGMVGGPERGTIRNRSVCGSCGDRPGHDADDRAVSELAGKFAVGRATVRGTRRRQPAGPDRSPVGGRIRRLTAVDARPSAQRRRIMQAVGSRDTAPEMAVRRLLHRSGYRYRLHRKDLPGRPDIVFVSRRKAIFVHGCFWHGHDCPKGRLPKSRRDYWVPKLRGNRERDARNADRLRSMGWEVLAVWECETADLDALAARLFAFLGRGQSSPASGALCADPERS